MDFSKICPSKVDLVGHFGQNVQWPASSLLVYMQRILAKRKKSGNSHNLLLFSATWWPVQQIAVTFTKGEKWYQPQVVLYHMWWPWLLCLQSLHHFSLCKVTAICCTQSLHHFSLCLQGHCNLLYQRGWFILCSPHMVNRNVKMAAPAIAHW